DCAGGDDDGPRVYGDVRLPDAVCHVNWITQHWHVFHWLCGGGIRLSSGDEKLEFDHGTPPHGAPRSTRGRLRPGSVSLGLCGVASVDPRVQWGVGTRALVSGSRLAGGRRFSPTLPRFRDDVGPWILGDRDGPLGPDSGDDHRFDGARWLFGHVPGDRR